MAVIVSTVKISTKIQLQPLQLSDSESIFTLVNDSRPQLPKFVTIQHDL